VNCDIINPFWVVGNVGLLKPQIDASSEAEEKGGEVG